MMIFLLFVVIFICLLSLYCSFCEFKKNLEENYEQLEQRIIKLEDSTSEQNILNRDSQKEVIEGNCCSGNIEAGVIENMSIAEKKSRKSKSIENIFFGSIFNKIGAVALVAAVCIFIMFVSQFIVFTPLMSAAAGFVAGLVFVFIFLNMHNKNNMKLYAEVLSGLGLVVLFISLYCAIALFHLLSPFVGVVSGIILLLFSYFLAWQYKSYSALGIGLFCGYLNPFFLSDNLPETFLSGYLIFLNAVALVYVYKNEGKRWLNFVNLFLTAIFLFGNTVFLQAKLSIVCPIVLWLMYLSFDLLRILGNKIKHEKEHYFTSYMNLGVLVVLSWLVFTSNRMFLGAVLFAYAVVYFILVVFFLSRSQKKILRPYFYSLIALVYMGTFFVSSGMTRVFLWALEMLFITSLRYQLDLKYLTKWVLFFSLTCVVSLLGVESSMVYAESYVPVLNPRLLLFSIPALVMFGCSYILRKCPKNRDVQVSLFLTFLYSTLIYLYIIFEFNSWIAHSASVSNSVDNIFVTLKAMVNVCIGFIYAMHLKFLADIKESYIFRLLSYLMWGVSAVFLVLLGVRYIPVEDFLPILNLRVFAFVVAIASALVYSKMWKKYLFDYLAISLGFLLISYETADYLIKYGLYDSSCFVITIMWILYLAVLSLFGLAFDVKSLKHSAICISILAVFKIIFYDIAGLEDLYKIVVFLILGVVLMLISYLYNRLHIDG